ncbi:MAG TPA: peptidylprolyl isomerase [candidate division Zixibacteria bacterium]|nr:peptidylprolyl isomerase [candidate division Zixibacteria bacterium]
MATAESGDKVKVHYSGKLQDGTIFDSSVDREPLEFMLGQGQVIPGFDQGIMGMASGEKKELSIPADQAYGPRRDELIAQVNRSVFPNEIEPEIGKVLQMETKEGQTINVQVTAIEGDNVTLDANHPLAGKDLFFEIELVEITKP